MTYGKTSNASIKPQGLGMMGPSSTYGSTIPSVFGCTRIAPTTIWTNDLKKGPSAKKGKASKKGKGGGLPTYTAAVDFLLASNPVVAPLTIWANQNQTYGLNRYAVYEFDSVFNPHPSQVIAWADPKFYCVLGVTCTPFVESKYVNEYGNPNSPYTAPEALNDEMPLWNLAVAGPNPTNPTAARMWPWCYVWRPGDGPSIIVPAMELGGLIGFVLSLKIKIYYAQLLTAGVTPQSQLNLEFEATLGSGSEYANHLDQQIQYPIYAGLSSPQMDLGSGTAFPDLRIEVLGSYPLYASGDCDFVDIVEDIFTNARCQTGSDQLVQRSAFQRGLSAFDYPGCTQKKAYSTVLYSDYSGPHKITGSAIPIYNPTFDQGNDGRGVLIVSASSWANWTTPATVSDVAGHTWAGVVPDQRSAQRQIWYALPSGSWIRSNMVGINYDASAWLCDDILLEIQGLDGAAFDSSAIMQSSGVSGLTSLTQSLTVTNDPDKPCYIVSLLYISTGGVGTDDMCAAYMSPRFPLSPLMTPQDGTTSIYYGNTNYACQRADACTVKNPGTYTFTYDLSYAHLSSIPTGAEWTWVLMAFKATQPASYSKGIGDILDRTTLELTRTQCRANGLYGSLAMDSQKTASDWLKDLYSAMNAAPVWSGFHLKSIPYSEVIATGNGVRYFPPTMSGPIANLGADDFIGAGNDPLITVNIKAVADCQNVISIQHPNRASNYVDVTASQPNSGAIANNGTRKDGPTVLKCIQDDAIACMIGNIMNRRENVIDKTYSFKLNARWKLLEPMDLVTISDPLIGINQLPVRLTSISEGYDLVLDCEAEPFVWGMCSPQPVSITAHVQNSPDKMAVPASVNAPIFIESTAQLGQATQAEIWIAVSDSDVVYGGCQLNVSTDGGTTYKKLGAMTGNAITGKLTGNWPLGTDPDTTNNLLLDLSESLGSLDSMGTADEDSDSFPFIVQTGSTYEAGGYAVATLTGANAYTLQATGGNHLRRGRLGTTIAAHVTNDRFAYLGANATGVVKVALDPAWIGATLKFKIQAVNIYGYGVQDISACAVYSYTVLGTFVSTFQGTSQKNTAGGYAGLNNNNKIGLSQLGTPPGNNNANLNNNLVLYGDGTWKPAPGGNGNGNYVPLTRNVNTTAPLSGGGNLNNDLTLAMAQANANANGYLNNNDWSNFNNTIGSAPSSRNINTTAPLAGGGNLSADLTLSMPKANANNNGYLAATDWANFNNGGSGGVPATRNINTTAPLTGGGALNNNLNLGITASIGTTAPLAGGGALNNTMNLSIAQANANANGFLSSSDWSQFNNASGGGLSRVLWTPIDIRTGGADAMDDEFMNAAPGNQWTVCTNNTPPYSQDCNSTWYSCLHVNTGARNYNNGNYQQYALRQAFAPGNNDFSFTTKCLLYMNSNNSNFFGVRLTITDFFNNNNNNQIAYSYHNAAIIAYVGGGTGGNMRAYWYTQNNYVTGPIVQTYTQPNTACGILFLHVQRMNNNYDFLTSQDGIGWYWLSSNIALNVSVPVGMIQLSLDTDQNTANMPSIDMGVDWFRHNWKLFNR